MTGGDLQELQEQLQQTTTTNWTSNGNATSTAVDGSDTSNNQHGSIIPSTQHVQQQQFMQHLINLNIISFDTRLGRSIVCTPPPCHHTYLPSQHNIYSIQ